MISKKSIPFNKPYLTGKEFKYISDVFLTKKLSGNGNYTKKCQDWFEKKYKFGKCFLTSSCTDALEMAAILINIKPGDEVILPSYTFVSTANAFVLRGAKLVFIDSRHDQPNMNEENIESLITSKTKAIIPVHYAGVACNMEMIMNIANKHNIYVIEDAAQAIDGFYINKNGTKSALGSIGHLATFSFHETKNIISGEGGMLVVNDLQFAKRAEIIWEKGTNRSSFFRGEVDKYGWIDIGSSFLPSEITAAFLWAQLNNIEYIQSKRKWLWESYYKGLIKWAASNDVRIQRIPKYATNNGHMFYLIFPNKSFRDIFISNLKNEKIDVVFHYQSLHKSLYYKNDHDDRELKFSDFYTDCLVRLPMWIGLEQKIVINTILKI